MQKHIIVSLFIGLAGVSHAQTYPDHSSPFVNDYAELLPTSAEAHLAGRLAALREETGVEMTVVTLPSQDPYSNQSMERFAQGLFDHWGIGDAARNDGVLVLVLRDDRAMRIELGAAFGRDWDRAADAVIEDHFLPGFRAEDYPRGILNGSTAVIAEIVRPFHEGAVPEPAPDWSFPDPEAVFIGGFISLWLVGLANSLGIIRLSDLWARFRTCPSCGHRGLRQRSRVVMMATQLSEGQGERDIHCPQCDHRETQSYVIPRVRKSHGRGGSGGGFGGGRSGGGGASGRW